MKPLYLAIAAALLPVASMAQAAMDAYQASQSDFKGTARFMSMGGAFTALGGDLSTLNQNPAGIGIYRSSELGVTLDIDFQKTVTSPSYGPGFPSQYTQTKAYCNNFGYVGSTHLDGALRTFNWGVTYNRAVSFDRVYRGYVANTETSLSNYVASYTTAAQYTPDELAFPASSSSNYNPYLDSDCDWLSIMSFNSFIMNSLTNSSPYAYTGLMQNGTIGDAQFNIREQGYVDEYDISFGGNVENVVYWGLSVGITDLHYIRTIYYNESLGGALVPAYNPKGSEQPPLISGGADFYLDSRKYINGTGWNIKAGVILKPINELRIGLAVHTPTWYSVNQGYNGSIDAFFNPNGGSGFDRGDYTEDAYFNWRYNAPWRLMAGVAGVLNGRAIVSLDYEMDAYNAMKMYTPVYYNGFENGFEPDEYLNYDISNNYRVSNNVRLGLEYRVSPQFSLRAGYNVRTTAFKQDVADGLVTVGTSGTDPSYSIDKNTWYATCGFGYRYKAWYIDAAYVYKNRESTFHAFTNYDGLVAPQSSIKDTNSSVVFSTGFKF